jgi:hypothetical protein
LFAAVNTCEYINTTKESPDLLGDNKEVDIEANAEKPQNRPVQSAGQIFLSKYVAN